MTIKIVAVTACPTGVAHTYMAAEKLEQTAKKFGYSIKVETQGAMGSENIITDAEAKAADVAIFAADIAVSNRDRFAHLKIIEVAVHDVLKNCDAIFEQIKVK
jgi:fructose-specific phosphotransferase system IIB component